MGLFNFNKKKNSSKSNDEYRQLYNSSSFKANDGSSRSYAVDHPCVRESCTGTMILDEYDNLYKCTNCCTICPSYDYDAFLRGEITFEDDPTISDCDYDDVYDEDGDLVPCAYCRGYVKFKDGQYVCPTCGTVISRSEFFTAIGANPPGPLCLSCPDLYPGCVDCRYGYELEDDL